MSGYAESTRRTCSTGVRRAEVSCGLTVSDWTARPVILPISRWATRWFCITIGLAISTPVVYTAGVLWKVQRHAEIRFRLAVDPVGPVLHTVPCQGEAKDFVALGVDLAHRDPSGEQNRLPAAGTEVSRVRLLVEWSRDWQLADQALLGTRLEMGGSWDTGG